MGSRFEVIWVLNLKRFEMENKLPVVVLSGFLGSGKTTLIKSLLSEQNSWKIALIVNDMGEINVDANLIGNGTAKIVRQEEHLVEIEQRVHLLYTSRRSPDRSAKNRRSPTIRLSFNRVFWNFRAHACCGNIPFSR